MNPVTLLSIGLLVILVMAAAPSVVAAASLYDYKDITLDNGLRVVTLEDFSCPIVNVQLWYHVGSKNENPERQGFAHMFEHMMFRGTDRLGPTDHFDLLRRVGGTTNAYTSFDQTVYHETLPRTSLNSPCGSRPSGWPVSRSTRTPSTRNARSWRRNAAST
jgi:hypothetical protein